MYYKKRLRRTLLAPNTSTSLQTTLAADASSRGLNYLWTSRKEVAWILKIRGAMFLLLCRNF
jgi:hypothetical protein